MLEPYNSYVAADMNTNLAEILSERFLNPETEIGRVMGASHKQNCMISASEFSLNIFKFDSLISLSSNHEINKSKFN